MTAPSQFLGRSASACKLAEAIIKAAPTEASILIVGESGTGKEVIAREIHERSSRRNAPFVAVNCGAIVPSLAESELFGHEKGSFTGASSATMGYFERAHPGTLFLDEAAEMPLAMQVQLLRVLESGQYHRVGGSELQNVDLRIIAATNQDPKQSILAGRFRPDLFYRLAVFPIRVPPLRERKPDIVYLSQRFLQELNEQENSRKVFSAGTLANLENYNWPGNIRELKNTITRAYILAENEIDIAPLGPVFESMPRQARQEFLKIPVGTSILAAQQAIIKATLDYYSGDRRRTAQALGISQKTLYNRLGQLRKPARAS